MRVQARRAEQKAAELQHFLGPLRSRLSGCLTATSGLERNMRQLSSTAAPCGEALPPEQLEACKAEALQSLAVIRQSLWRVLSADV